MTSTLCPSNGPRTRLDSENDKTDAQEVNDAPEPLSEESDELYDATLAPSYIILQAANPLPE